MTAVFFAIRPSVALVSQVIGTRVLPRIRPCLSMECLLMARLARAEVFDPSEIAGVHVRARTVRRCYLLGFDPVSEKDLDNRKLWIECKLQQLGQTRECDIFLAAW